MIENGRVPAVLSTRLSNVQRSKGHSLGATAAYCAAEKLRDYNGEVFDFRRKEGVAHVDLVGWEVRKGETLRDAIERFVIAAQGAEAHPRGIEGRTLRIDLPHEADPNLCRDLLDRASQKLRTELRIVVIACYHEPPEDGSGLNSHGHLVLGRREVDEHGTFGKDCRTFRDRARGSKYLRRFRDWLADEYNQEARIRGWQQRYTGLGYKELYDRINAHRKAERLELLEELIPTEHLGPAVTAKIRARERDGSVQVRSELADKNETTRAENARKAARNEARIGRDRGIQNIRPRLEAFHLWSGVSRVIRAEMATGERPIGHYDDVETAQLQVWKESMGRVEQLARDWKDLPDESRQFLASDYPTGALDLSKRALRLAVQEGQELIRTFGTRNGSPAL